MPYFAYTGRNARGELVQGVTESQDSGMLAAQLIDGGVIPVEIGETRAPDDRPGLLSRLFGEKVKPIDLLLFSRQMYTLLKAGVPILRALGGLQESTTSTAFKSVIKGIRENLESGREFASCLQRQGNVFSPFYVAMVYVGETTGMLEEIFLRLFHHLEFQGYMRSQVKSAVRYPIFVVVVMVIALIVINYFVIPAFARVYRGMGAKLPWITQLLIGVSDFMINYWWLLLGAALGSVFAFTTWVRSARGRYDWDRFKLRIPIAGSIVQKATLARFARSLALALKSGVPVVQALNLVAQVVDNRFVGERIEKMREGVERGESVLRTAVSAGVFTPVVLQMIVVGEESGALDEMLEEIGDMYQRETEYELKALGSQIEPILIVVLGVMVLIVALGVFLPIWDLGRVALGRGGGG